MSLFKKSKNQFGFYLSITTSLLTLLSFGIAIFTPPLSGPYCQSSCYSYPYLDVISRFPRDYLWMYAAILLYVVYVAYMSALHYYAAEEKKIYSQIGLSFALIAATILMTDYFVQLSVIQPSLLKGEVDGIAMLSQYNPHGLFIALEELGYLLMSIAFLFMVPIYSKDGMEKALRWLYLIGSLAVVSALVIYSLKYGNDREYRFEVFSISINWLVLIASGFLTARLFKRSF